MKSRLLIPFFLALEINCARGSVVATPSNTAVVAGAWMGFECRTDIDSTVREWTLTRTSTEQRAGANPGPSTPQKETILSNWNANATLGGLSFGAVVDDRGSGIIFSNHTRINDAGIYTCAVQTANKIDYYSAHLVVLERLPICERNFSAQTNDIWIKCRVFFRGLWAPIMEWKKHYHNNKGTGSVGEEVVTDGVTTIQLENREVTSILHLRGNWSDGVSFLSCTTYFLEYDGDQRTTSTSIPDFSHTHNFPVFYQHTTNLMTISSTEAVQRENVSIMTTTDQTQRQLPLQQTPNTEKVSEGNTQTILLGLITAVSVLFVLMIVIPIAIFFHFKKNVSGVLPKASFVSTSAAAGKSCCDGADDFTAALLYDRIPNDYFDGYACLDEAGRVNGIMRLELSPRSCPLPEPGYSGFLPETPIAPPSVYTKVNPLSLCGLAVEMDETETPDEVSTYPVSPEDNIFHTGVDNDLYLQPKELTGSSSIEDKQSPYLQIIGSLSTDEERAGSEEITNGDKI